MVGKRTVIVLGAGASCPYGFPNGVRLIDEIISLLKTSYFYDQINSFLYHEEDNPVEEFLEALINSNTSSIDDFLTFHKNNSNFQFIGKICILCSIGKYERPDRFRPMPQEKKIEAFNIQRDWYNHLWNSLYQGTEFVSDLKNNQITFITFNYDRSLEYFLKTSITGLYPDANVLTVKEILSKLPIYHIYGKIGELEYLPDINEPEYINEYSKDSTINQFYSKRPQSAQSLLRNMKKLTEKLWTYGENLPDLEKFQRIAHALDNADIVYFFGLSFHPQNIQILLSNVKNITKQRQIKGTWLGVSESAKDYAITYLSQHLTRSIKFDSLKDCTILEFMEKYGL